MANGTATRRAAAQPRVYPVGRAVLLLAVSGAELAGRRMTVDGRRIQAVQFGSLALLVSFVDQLAYSGAEIERKRGEPAWLATEARTLERAVDRANANGPVLPMKLLTVFAHSDALEECARDHEARWARALARIGTKRECVVHVYGGPHLPPGAQGAEAYVARVSEHATRGSRLPAWKGETSIIEALASLWRDVTALAIASRRIEPAPGRGAFFAVALLLAENDLAVLRTLVEQWGARAAPLGLMVYLEGPRLPFTFV